MKTLKLVLAIIGCLLLLFITFPIWGTILLGWYLTEKYKFWSAPPECCQGGCKRCPWGDWKQHQHQAAYLDERRKKCLQGFEKFQKPHVSVRHEQPVCIPRKRYPGEWE